MNTFGCEYKAPCIYLILPENNYIAMNIELLKRDELDNVYFISHLVIYLSFHKHAIKNCHIGSSELYFHEFVGS
jgi:hypothetical protein